MTDIQSRPFSKNYSGLINQSVIATGITLLCVAGHEFLKRKRRGKGLCDPSPGLGSRETWECGYLYQARSWSRFPSPPLPAGWPLSWVKPAVDFPEDQLRKLRGIDATIYVRFLRGCFWYALIHLLTTFPILFPIHIDFSDASVSPKSMTRASISSLVGTSKGRSLLWIHISLLFWLTLSWIAFLLWICDGAFKMRAANIEEAAETRNLTGTETKAHHPHPHRQYAFTDVPSAERDRPVPGMRLRTVMVANIPQALRTEKDLRDYFEYYMSRKVEKPAVGITSSSQPGFINKSLAFLLNRAKRVQEYFPQQATDATGEDEEKGDNGVSDTAYTHPIIERVVIARKMTELASLVERREQILVHLETAHIRLASKALLAVKIALEGKPPSLASPKAAEVAKKRRSLGADGDRGISKTDESVADEREAMERLVEVLHPFVEDFCSGRNRSKRTVPTTTTPENLQKLPTRSPSEGDDSGAVAEDAHYPPKSTIHRITNKQQTVWEALLSLPRSTLDAYQPLIHLNHLFSGKVVPSIDYYTAKLNLLSSLVTENRAKPPTDFDPTSTAFVTFADPADARRACKYLAVHPNNPLVCLVTMAPMYSDIDWKRVMKSSLKVEFVKDWVVSIGVWAFTIFWFFPLSFLVGLISIQNVSLFWPTLKQYLDRNPDKSEVLQSLIPTLLVSLLSLLIPPILLLIAKKFHLITTTSVLHDMLLTRYYKFLIVNLLVFFCVGTAAVQSLLQSLTSSSSHKDVIQIVADSFPTAGPFYVGWLIFSTALHAGIELSLIGVPLIRHLFCSRQRTPRKRSIYLRPPRPNFYYWFPNHCLVLHVLLLFSVLNPLVLPFGTLYFFVQTGVMKNQFIHVYSKNLEGDGKFLLIRIVRYGLDGLVLSQAVFLAYMVVLRKSVNAGLAAFLIVFTVLVKIILTRMCRARFELDDAAEADVICYGRPRRPSSSGHGEMEDVSLIDETHGQRTQYYTPPRNSSLLTVRLPDWLNFSYAAFNRRHGMHRHRPRHRLPNPFGPHRNSDLTVPPAVKPYRQNNREPTEGLPEREKDGPLIVAEPTYHVEEKGEDIIRRARRPIHTTIHQETRVVTPHSAPAPWDDQCFPDLPYDNPFYSRAIDDALWLPRNPLGFLDLDDTVDLRVSITVDQYASRLGSWIGIDGRLAAEGVSGTPSSDATPPGAGFSSTATHLPIDVQDVDGTEEIVLPPVIAQRVQAGEKDVGHMTRPRKMSLPRRTSSGDHSVRTTGRSTLRRPSILDFSPPTLYRSPSTFSQRRARSGSLMSTLQESSPGFIEKGKSTERGSPGLRPDAHAQADFVAASASASRVSLTSRPGLPRTQTISAAQAIFQEVLEEEREALNDRLEEETAEVEAELRKQKSWFPWLYWRSE